MPPLGYTGPRRRHPWAKACLYLVLAVLPVLPWLARNIEVSGKPFGLLFHEVLADTYIFPTDSLMRSIQPVIPEAGATLFALKGGQKEWDHYHHDTNHFVCL